MILRSVAIGDFTSYCSEYLFGVNQAMTMMGHFHIQIDYRNEIGVMDTKIKQVNPHIIWFHGVPTKNDFKKTQMFLDLGERWKSRGAKVVIHDGDVSPNVKYPNNISDSADIVLCNHTNDRSVWGIKQLHWPYFAFVQDEIAKPCQEFVCDLAFAGKMGEELYADRSKIVRELKRKMGGRFKIFPTDDIPHTLYRTPELAASAGAVIGYGRPEANGWVDVRVFQYPGAGGVLIHDDVKGFLEPYVHYIPYKSGSVDSIIEAVEISKEKGGKIRMEGFRYVQQNHSAINRVSQVLKEVGLG